jgi:UDP-N-acetylglucosamine--N-acetylmuramyl-(pentapeptide) pyrophosphoryl-undecaprenol N-acetylglucosamine transferase
MRNDAGTSRRKPIIVMAGGTGGHIYPALAVAHRLREQGVPLLWLGSRRGMENRIVPPTGIDLLTIAVSGLRGRSPLSLLLGPFKLAYALLQALSIIARARPAAVLGMGGFASGPGGLAAWLLRIPLLVHEQNAIAGYTNRLLAPLATRLMTAFPNTFPRRMAIHIGNPVRTEIAAVEMPPRRHDDGALRVLVLGGSQGARALNQALPSALALAASRIPSQRFEVWHQAGADKLDAARAAYASAQLPANVHARIDAYIEQMADGYRWADVVVCRSGAMTIAELSAAGVASVLVPFPYAVDDHQTANARYLSDAGAAILLPESELSVERLAGVLAEFAKEPARSERMAVAARTLGRPQATEEVAAICMEVAYA